MNRNTLLAVAALAVVTLGGCEIYFGPGPGPGSQCNAWGCPDETPPMPGEPGWSCFTSDECMAGCFCSDQGICEESGFCEVDWECAMGFECDQARATCVPAGASGCNIDSDCGAGWYCDAASGSCIPSGICDSATACPPGYQCSDNGTCVPVPCADDSACLQGCYCDVASGQCVESGFCMSAESNDCQEGFECDETRGTCVPDVSQPSCGGDVSCNLYPPACAVGQVPLVEDGCYTGECSSVDACDVAPTCEDLQHEADCTVRSDCSAVYSGDNCTCNGAPCSCSESPASCVCQIYTYEGCESPR